MKRHAWLAALVIVAGCAAKSGDETKANPSDAKAAQSVVDVDGSLSRIRNAGVLKVGADLTAGLPFWSPGHASGEPPLGFEAELANQLATQLGVKVQVVPTKWKDLLPDLQAGRYDVALNGLETPSAETRKQWGELAFSKPYLDGGEWIIVPPEDKTTDRVADLKGMHVGVLRASVDATLLEAANKQHKLDIKLVPQSKMEGLFTQIEKRVVDAAVLPQPIAALFLVQNPTFHVAGKPLMAQGYVMAVRRADKALLNTIDTWLSKSDRDKAFQALMAKWKMKPGD